MGTGPTSNRTTPGVYINELSAFPSSVVGVATAVPIFIGYTETAIDPSSKEAMYLQSIPISSMEDYISWFGNGYTPIGAVEPQPTAPAPEPEPEPEAASVSTPAQPPAPVAVPTMAFDFQAQSSTGSAIDIGNYVVGTSVSASGAVAFAPPFNLFQAMQLFFANGGSDCFVISVGNYWGNKDNTSPTSAAAPGPVSKDDLLAGLAVAQEVRGATMLVTPDACMLFSSSTSNAVTTYGYDTYAPVAVGMIDQAGTLQDRMAILDMPGALLPDNRTFAAMEQTANAFYAAIAPSAANFSYGACYGPAIATALLSPTDVTYANLKGTEASTMLMNNLLTTQALSLFPPTEDDTTTTYSAQFVDVAAHIAAAFPVASDSVTALADTVPANTTGTTLAAPNLLVSMPSPKSGVPSSDADVTALDQYLRGTLPLLGQALNILVDKLNVAPPSGAIAGIWARTDAQQGVWNAPANVAIAGAVEPLVQLTDAQQGDFNVPINGNAIDILRAFPNRGTVVWGARTLDGNDLEYRYIQVRRTLIYIQQSIQNALGTFAFAPNDGNTWMTVHSTISGFLTQLWQAGGLMGAKASEAFTVNCGLGTTMTAQDVIDGVMNVHVSVQIIHPAEFITLSFVQTMQAS